MPRYEAVLIVSGLALYGKFRGATYSLFLMLYSFLSKNLADCQNKPIWMLSISSNAYLHQALSPSYTCTWTSSRAHSLHVLHAYFFSTDPSVPDLSRSLTRHFRNELSSSEDRWGYKYNLWQKCRGFLAEYHDLAFQHTWLTSAGVGVLWRTRQF